MDVRNANRQSGFGISTDDSFVLTSTYDAHRYSKMAEGCNVSFSPSIPITYRTKALTTLRSMGAPMQGEPYATHSHTYQSDSEYVRSSLHLGRPRPRRVYASNGRVVFSDGQYGLSPSLMGPLSRTRLIFGYTDVEWKNITRLAPLESYLINSGIPYTKVGSKIFVSNVCILVSGHVLNYILNTALLCTNYSRAFDLGGFRDAYVEDMKTPVLGSEPSFTKYAWHSWLETEVAVISAFRVIRALCKGGFPLKRDAVKLALMAGVDLLRHNVRNGRTTISVVRQGLSKYDPRYYTAPRDYKHVFIVMPSGTGKSFLSDKYPHLFCDIDGAMTEVTKPVHKRLIRDAIARKDWGAYNSWYHKVCYNYIDEVCSRSSIKAFLIHHPIVADTLFPHAPRVGLLLERAKTISQAHGRSGGDAGLIAASNWDSVFKEAPLYRNFKIHVCSDNQELESMAVNWTSAYC